MPRAKSANRTHVAGESRFSETDKQEIRTSLARRGLCDCQSEEAGDCRKGCPVRSFVDEISYIVFASSAEISNPKERAATLDKFQRYAEKIRRLLEPSEETAQNGRIIKMEGRSEELQILDETLLKFFGTDPCILPGAYSSPLVELLRRLEEVSRARQVKLLTMKRARRRAPGRELGEELVALWHKHFGRIPPATETSSFIELLIRITGTASTSALKARTERARKKTKKSTK